MHINNTEGNKIPHIQGEQRRSTSGFNEAFHGIFNDENKGVNGEIDEAVFQGTKGDCWLLSGVLSLSYTQDGKELIKNSIFQNKNGDYEVWLEGLGKSYTVSKEELESKNVSTLSSGLGLESSSYSTGDDDMLLMELAVEKAVQEGNNDIVTQSGITGGSAYYLYNAMSDNEVQYAYGDDPIETVNLLNEYAMNQNECAATLGITDGFAGLEDNHAYAVKKVTQNTTTLVNPWDTTEDITISNSTLVKNLGKYDVSVVEA